MGSSNSSENSDVEQDQTPHGDLYTIKDTKVYWKGRQVGNVHANFFTPLDCGYGKDDWQVYYHDRRLKEIKEPKLFKVYHNGAATDGEHFYYKGTLISPEEFHSKHYNKTLKEVAPSNMYNIKNNQVYWDKNKVENSAHGEFFSYVGGGYGKDYWYAYYHEHRLPDVKEIISFKYNPDSNTATDGTVTYKNGQLV